MKLKLCTFVLSLLVAGSAWGDVIVQFTQHPDGVHADVSGSVNLGPLSFEATGIFPIHTDIGPSLRSIDIEFTNSVASAYSLPAHTLPSFGTAGFVDGTWVSGIFDLEENGSVNDVLFLSPSYVSGSPLTASAIYPGTFASYGFPSSDVHFTLPGSQHFTYEFISTPEPATAPMVAGAFALLAWAVRRRRLGAS